VSSLILNDSNRIAWTSGDIPLPIISDLAPIELITPARTYVNFTNMIGIRVENKGLIESENFNITLTVEVLNPGKSLSFTLNGRQIPQVISH